MRNGAWCLLIVLLGAGRAFAQSPEEVFARGNDLYQQGKYDEARDAYESVLRNGFVSAGVYYNLGNTYYKLGQISRAILQYERALRLSPNDEDLKHNLELANLSVKDRTEPAPRLFLWDTWDGLKNAFSLTAVTWWGYGAYLGVIVAAGFFLLVPSYRARRLAFLAGLSAGSLLIVALVLFLAKRSDLQTRDAAIVLTEIVNVKNSPDARSTDAFVLHGGVKVQITDQVSEWIKIRLADGKVGWMNREAVEVI